MALAVVALTCSSVQATGAAVSGSPSKPQPSLGVLIPLLRRVRDYYEAPGIDITTAAKHLHSAQRAYEFVRDDVVHLTYSGRMQSAVGTLRTRTGNGVDHTALLGALLEAQGYEVQYLVSNSLPPGAKAKTGRRHLERIPALQTLAKKIGYRLNGRAAEERSELKAAKPAVRQIRAEVDASYHKLETVLGDSFGASDLGAPADEWWWLQACKKGHSGKWVTYDPTYPQVGEGAGYALPGCAGRGPDRAVQARPRSPKWGERDARLVRGARERARPDARLHARARVRSQRGRRAYAGRGVGADHPGREPHHQWTAVHERGLRRARTQWRTTGVNRQRRQPRRRRAAGHHVLDGRRSTHRAPRSARHPERRRSRGRRTGSPGTSSCRTASTPARSASPSSRAVANRS